VSEKTKMKPLSLSKFAHGRRIACEVCDITIGNKQIKRIREKLIRWKK